MIRPRQIEDVADGFEPFETDENLANHQMMPVLTLELSRICTRVALPEP